MKFRNKYVCTPVPPSNPGSRFHNDYKIKVFDDGSRDLVVVGQIDTYEMIQSHKDSVDLKLTLERYARGDESAINRRQAFFGDFTHMPTSLSELSQRILDAQDLFNTLDVDARRAFDFDAGRFFASIGTPEFESIVSQFNPKPDKPIIQPVGSPTGSEPVGSPTGSEPVAEPVPSNESQSANKE